jgi:hypothetical protein
MAHRRRPVRSRQAELEVELELGTLDQRERVLDVDHAPRRLAAIRGAIWRSVALVGPVVEAVLEAALVDRRHVVIDRLQRAIQRSAELSRRQRAGDRRQLVGLLRDRERRGAGALAADADERVLHRLVARRSDPRVVDLVADDVVVERLEPELAVAGDDQRQHRARADRALRQVGDIGDLAADLLDQEVALTAAGGAAGERGERGVLLPGVMPRGARSGEVVLPGEPRPRGVAIGSPVGDRPGQRRGHRRRGRCCHRRGSGIGRLEILEHERRRVPVLQRRTPGRLRWRRRRCIADRRRTHTPGSRRGAEDIAICGQGLQPAQQAVPPAQRDLQPACAGGGRELRASCRRQQRPGQGVRAGRRRVRRTMAGRRTAPGEGPRGCRPADPARRRPVRRRVGGRRRESVRFHDGPRRTVWSFISPIARDALRARCRPNACEDSISILRQCQ